MGSLLAFQLNNIQNAFPPTINLILSQKRNGTVLLRMQKFHLLKIWFYDGFETLMNMERQETQKLWEDVENNPNS